MAKGEMRYSREVAYNPGQEYCDTLIYAVKGPRRGRRSLGKPTSEAQEVINERHAKMHFKRMADANFVEGRDQLLHLTFDEPHKPATRRECKRIVDNFLRRVKRAWEKRGASDGGASLSLRYLYVIEGEDGHRLHVHMLITGGLTLATVKELWGRAEVLHLDTLQAGKNGYEALSVYLNKQGRLSDGEHRWYGSRNLVKPDYEERNARIRMEEVAELGEYIANVMDADEGVIPTAERYAPIEERYPGYYCSEAEAKFLESFGEWVIHIKLYRKDTPSGRAEQKRRRLEERIIRKSKAASLCRASEVI